jgi:hypothetical protein
LNVDPKYKLPPRSPAAKLVANKTPIGIRTDSQKRKVRDTLVAFWTEAIANKTIQTAAIVHMKNKEMFIRLFLGLGLKAVRYLELSTINY